MDKYLKPSRFDCDPNAAGADKQFKHWLKTFQNFVSTIKFETAATAGTEDTVQTAAAQTEQLKLTTLVNYIAANVYEYIADSETYDDAINTLTNIYVKPVNEIYARYKLATCQQSEGESIDAFIQNLHRLSKECNFKNVTAEEHRQGYVRDAFISGIRSREIRQKLLENEKLTMEQVFIQARTLQLAQTNAAKYSAPGAFTACATNMSNDTNKLEVGIPTNHEEGVVGSNIAAAAAQPEMPSCGWCGYPSHPRSQCPAKKHKCKLCGKVGHWERMCRSSNR